MTKYEFTKGEIRANLSITKRSYDLEARTTSFGQQIVTFARKLSITVVTKPLISQLVRAATSVGANYCEANDALSKKDFYHRIGISRKEAKETRYWLRMLYALFPNLKDEIEKHIQEAHELNLIFSSIIRRKGTK